MAFHTILKFSYTLAAMLALNRCGCVLMAAVAGVCLQGLGMADLAFALSAYSVAEWEGMWLFEAGWAPALHAMATGTLVAEKAGMQFRLGVAGETFLGRASEGVFLVAILTGHLQMPAFQRKIGQ